MRLPTLWDKTKDPRHPRCGCRRRTAPDMMIDLSQIPPGLAAKYQLPPFMCDACWSLVPAEVKTQVLAAVGVADDQG